MKIVNLLFCACTLAALGCGKATGDCLEPDLVTVSAGESHPCDPSGTVAILDPLGAGYRYRIDAQPFQEQPLFIGVGVGRHRVAVQDADGCVAEQEVVVDTVIAGPAFREVARVLALRCADCHNGFNPQSGLDFTAPCDVLRHWDRIRERAVIGEPSPMPPTGLISSTERQTIEAWIASGHRYQD
jgi:cytochrome c551/c552